MSDQISYGSLGDIIKITEEDMKKFNECFDQVMSSSLEEAKRRTGMSEEKLLLMAVHWKDIYSFFANK